MKKTAALLLALLMLLGVVSASAQTVVCPAGGFSLTLPDSFSEIPRSPGDDRDLVLQYSDGSVNLAVYVSYAGTDNPFLVLTGDEIEYGPVSVNGVTMQYARGRDDQGPWATYSWQRTQDAVALYFVWTGSDDAALSLIRKIMSSISFG